MFIRPRCLTSLAAFFVAVSLLAQSRQSVQWRYIENYKDMAVDQMRRYKIPASITLAQGLCESSAGQSRLAREAHNHFGIKVGTNWTGPYIVMADDRPDDRFRKYRTDDESYEDHSRFLTQNARYRSLFNLKLTDYKGWAHGLKRCGYATSPNYGPMLIGVIERYNLQQFDSYVKGKYHSKHENGQAESRFFQDHIVYRVNRLYMIIANRGDTWEYIAQETGVSASKLRRYNEVPKGYQLRAGDYVFLQKKRKKGDKGTAGVPHVLAAGESVYDVAQHYGIRLKNLYRLNGWEADHVHRAGELIWLR